MYRASNGTPDQAGGFDEQAAEEVERRLAQYVFVREERDREVRLLFRDVPAPNLVLSFRAAGANLISISGERLGAKVESAEPDSPAIDTEPDQAATEQTEPRQGQKGRRRRTALPPPPSGELLMRYFFSLGETVYTVNLASPTGVVGSVASIYPVARLAEEELRQRLNVIFT
jgi:hypothetical protein